MVGCIWYWIQVVKVINDSDFKVVEISVSLKESCVDNIIIVVVYFVKLSEVI